MSLCRAGRDDLLSIAQGLFSTPLLESYPDSFSSKPESTPLYRLFMKLSSRLAPVRLIE